MRRFVLLTALAFPALPLLSGVVFAQTAAAPAVVSPAPAATGSVAPAAGVPNGKLQKWQARFAAANTTHDGHLTLAQAQAADMKRLVAHFDAIDTQHLGYVTFDELVAWRVNQRALMQAQKAAPVATTTQN